MLIVNVDWSDRFGNPEPSRQYTGGRCRDYLRTRVFLITGKSVPPLTIRLRVMR